MRPILFHVPFLNLPVHGYGMMLFLAYLLTQMLAKRLCKREGVDPKLIPDLTIWLFISGIIGGRLVFISQNWHNDLGNGFGQRPFWEMFKLWDGGLVLYGALFGAAVGFFGYDHFVLQKNGVSRWKMLDIIAPCVALGIALGRIGCLFTGCCYGNVAGDSCPSIYFPHASAGWAKMVDRGYQTPLGFLYDERTFEVDAIEPGTAAAEVLKPRDIVLEVNGVEAHKLRRIVPTDGILKLTVFRDGKTETLPTFEPTSLGLNPTQIYETISMCLLLFFLLSYHPYKQRDGELFVLLMFGYGVHRFLNEMLRTDTDPVAFGLTLSQNISIGILVGAIVLAVMVWRRKPAGERSEPAG